MTTVTLEEIWTIPPSKIKLLLNKPDINDILAKVIWTQQYNEGNQLSPEDALIVNHPQFTKTALKFGRLEDIVSKIKVLIYLEPLFNERNLLEVLNNYNPIKYLYLMNKNILEIRDLDSRILISKVSLPLLSGWNESPFYHKGKIYFITRYESGERILLSVDLFSGEIWDLNVRGFIMCIVGDLLYYSTTIQDLLVIDLQSDDNISINLPLNSNYVIEDNLLYVYDTKELTVSIYNLATLPLTFIERKRLPMIPIDGFCISFIGNRVFTDTSKVYDLSSLELVADLGIEMCENFTFLYEGKLYILKLNGEEDEPDPNKHLVSIYDNSTYELLGGLGQKDVITIEGILYNEFLVVSSHKGNVFFTDIFNLALGTHQQLEHDRMQNFCIG
jgi:hypothetical protein